jgi:hypothetical protein
MTVYHSEQIDQLRDLLVDPTDTQVAFDQKMYYLNAGLRAMFPRVHRIATDATTQWVDDQYYYTLPAAVRGGHLFLIEASTADDDDYFRPLDFDEYDIIPGAAGADNMSITWDPGSTYADGYIRFHAALPATPYVAASYVASQTEAYTYPDHTMEGPVLYAMSRIMAIPLDRRMDYTRHSVQAMNRAASPGEIVSVSAYWLDEFERRVEEWRMALPQGRY